MPSTRSAFQSPESANAGLLNYPHSPLLYPLQISPLNAGAFTSRGNVPTTEAINQVDVQNIGDESVASASAPALAPVVVNQQANASRSLDFLPAQMNSSEPNFNQPSIVSGMFPEVDAMQRALYDQQRQQAMQAQALQFAQLDPMARAQYALYLGGQQLGGAIGGALGAKDPQLQMIGLQQQILKELDPSDPNQQLQIARKYAQVAPELAIKIADNARSSLVKIAQANKENKASVAPDIQKSQRAAIITSAINQYKTLPQTPEVTQAIETLQTELDFLKPKPEATAKEIQIAKSLAEQKAAKGTPEYNAEYVSQLLRLTDQKENIIDVGVADKTREVVYFDKKSNEQFIMKPNASGVLVRTPYSGGIDKTTAKVSATAENKGQEAGSKEIYTLYAKRLDDANKASMKALDQAGVLKQMLDTPQPITGGAVGFRTAALRAFNTLGLTSSKDTQALNDADSFNSLAGQHVLTFIKTLGVNPTDADVRFAKSIGPDLQKSPEANATLINYLLTRAKDVMTEADNMEKHYTDNKGSLAGYKSVFRRNIESPVKPVEQMTREELKAAIEAKKREAAQ
jgi:hypothetical protein